MPDNSQSHTESQNSFTADSDLKVPEEKVAGACELLDKTLGSVITHLRGALHPDKTHLRRGEYQPEHIVARIVSLMTDTSGFGGPDALPDFLHIGWDRHSRTAFETAVESGLQLDTRLTAYCFLAKAIGNDDTDLHQFPGGAEQKARYRTRQNLCIPWFDRYTPLHLDDLLIVRLADTSDGQDDIAHIRCNEEDITGNYPFDQMQEAAREGHTPAVHVLELTEDDIGDLVDFSQLPGVGTSGESQTNPDGIAPDGFIERANDPRAVHNDEDSDAAEFFRQAAQSSPGPNAPSQTQPISDTQQDTQSEDERDPDDSSPGASPSPPSDKPDSPTPAEVLEALEESHDQQ